MYTLDARAAGASANDVHRIYSAQNSANVADHVATTCSISSLFVHDAHYYYVVVGCTDMQLEEVKSFS